MARYSHRWLGHLNVVTCRTSILLGCGFPREDTVETDEDISWPLLYLLGTLSTAPVTGSVVFSKGRALEMSLIPNFSN